MDKPTAKRVFAAAGIPGAPRTASRRATDLSAGEPMPRPYVVKPLERGLERRRLHRPQPGRHQRRRSTRTGRTASEVMVERYIPGRELTVAVMGDRPLAVTEISHRAAASTTTTPSTPRAGREHVRAGADARADVYDQAMRLAALAAHRALGCRGVPRRLPLRRRGEQARFYLLEVNTQPGMTPLSLVPEQAAPRRHLLRRTGAPGWWRTRRATDEAAAACRRASDGGQPPRRGVAAAVLADRRSALRRLRRRWLAGAGVHCRRWRLVGIRLALPSRRPTARWSVVAADRRPRPPGQRRAGRGPPATRRATSCCGLSRLERGDADPGLRSAMPPRERLERAALGRATPRSSAGCPTRSSSASSRRRRSRSGSTTARFALIDTHGQVIHRRQRLARLRQAAAGRRRRTPPRHAARAARRCCASEPDADGRGSRRRCGSAAGAGTCASTTASTCACRRTDAAGRLGAAGRLERTITLLGHGRRGVDLRLPDRLIVRRPIAGTAAGRRTEPTGTDDRTD